jgi:hypothetical protein
MFHKRYSFKRLDKESKLWFGVQTLVWTAQTRFSIDILNVVIAWISWGVAPGYINIAPLGLFGSYFMKGFSKNPFQAKVSLRETFA